ncbi:MAG: hypothetical protein DCC68_08200 [Planctomycetota bacterium]|nr:MAG: hypothetical protein DCC68_08200 [Planctomycetota bacterium]
MPWAVIDAMSGLAGFMRRRVNSFITATAKKRRRHRSVVARGHRRCRGDL